jgi:hypothetical protein
MSRLAKYRKRDAGVRVPQASQSSAGCIAACSRALRSRSSRRGIDSMRAAYGGGVDRFNRLVTQPVTDRAAVGLLSGIPCQEKRREGLAGIFHDSI